MDKGLSNFSESRMSFLLQIMHPGQRQARSQQGQTHCRIHLHVLQCSNLQGWRPQSSRHNLPFKMHSAAVLSSQILRASLEGQVQQMATTHLLQAQPLQRQGQASHSHRFTTSTTVRTCPPPSSQGQAQPPQLPQQSHRPSCGMALSKPERHSRKQVCRQANWPLWQHLRLLQDQAGFCYSCLQLCSADKELVFGS